MGMQQDRPFRPRDGGELPCVLECRCPVGQEAERQAAGRQRSAHQGFERAASGSAITVR